MRRASVVVALIALLTASLVAPASAAVAVNGNSNAQSASADGTTITFSGLTAAAGDTQVCWLIAQGNRSFTLQSGFALVDSAYNSGAGTSGTSYYTAVSSTNLVAGPSFSVATGARLAGLCIEVSGASGVDVHSIGYTSSTTSASSSAVTPTGTNEAFLAFYGNDDSTGGTTTTPPSGFTTMPPGGGANGNPFEVRGYYQLNPALSSQAPADVFANTSNMAAAYVVMTASGNSGIQVKGTSYQAASADGTSLIFSGLPATAGDVQVCHLMTQGNRTWTLPANFTAIDTYYDSAAGNSGTNNETVIAYSSLVAGPSFSVASNARLGGTCVELSGVATANAIDVHSIATQDPSTNNYSTAVSPTQTQEVFLAFFATNNGSALTVTTAPSGFTELSPAGGATGNPYQVRAFYQLNPALSSLQPTLVWSSSSYNNGAYVVLKPTVGC